MTIATGFIGECRPSTGSDDQGGGFIAGASGTDYSQQASAQVTYTDLEVDSVSAVKLRSTLNPFTSAHVGNILNILSGTGFTTGRYQVVSVVSNSATMDRAVGTLGSVDGVGKLGGAVATPDVIMVDLAANGAAGCKIFWKAEAQVVRTSTLTLTVPPVTPTFSTPANRLIGYGVTRGDGVRVQLKLSTNSGLIGINTTSTGWTIDGFDIDCSGLATSTGISVVNLSEVLNCSVRNSTLIGINANGPNCLVWKCEVVAASGTAGISTSSNCIIYSNDVHDCSCPGIITASGTNPFHNLVVNCSGSSSDGIRCSPPGIASENTVFNCGRHGIASTTGNFYEWLAVNNLLALNAGYGFAAYTVAPGIRAKSSFDGNAYYGNVSGTRLNADDTTTKPVNGVAPYTNVHDVVITISPFIKASVPVADLAVDGSNPLKVTSSSHAFTTAEIGATLYVVTQTGGWIMGQYTIDSVVGSAAILTESPGAVGSSSGAWYFDDFRLNADVDAGLSLRGQGVPTRMPGRSQEHFQSAGVYQEQSNVSNSVVIPMGHGSVSYFPGNAYSGGFVTCDAPTRARRNADSLPTANVVQNGTIDGAVSVTVDSAGAVGQYTLAFTIPGGYSLNDRLQVAVTAAVNGVTGTVIVDNFTLGVTYSTPGSLLLLGVG